MKYRILHFFNIREDELRPTVLFFLYLTIVTTAYVLAKNIRDGLFLSEYSALDIPYCYLAVAATVGVFVTIYLRVAARVNHRTLSTATLAFFLFNVLTFWWLFTFHPFKLLAAILYVWTNTFGIIAVVQVWTFANSALDTRQAKRLFGLIGGGGMVGFTLGGLCTQLATRLAVAGQKNSGSINLLLVFGGLLALSITIAQIAYVKVGAARDTAHSSRTPGAGRSALLPALRIVLRTRYLSLIAGLLVVEAISTLWIGIQFGYVSKAFIKGGDSLTKFFGTFTTYVSLIAFVVQFFLTARIMRTLGIGHTLFLLPGGLALSTGWLLAKPGFWPGLGPRTADQSLRYSLDKSALEMLYLPIPRDIKQSVKAVIDMVLQRCADATASIVILLATWYFSWRAAKSVAAQTVVIRELSLFNLVLFATWIVLAFAVGREYVAVVRRSIARREVDPDEVEASLSQPAALETLARMLDDPEERTVLYALDLLDRFDRLDLVPRSVLRHPSATVRARAIDIFRQHGDKSVVPDLESLMRDPVAIVGASALLAVSALRGESPREALLEYAAGSDPKMKAAAFAGLAAEGGIIGVGEGLYGLGQMAKSTSEEERIEVARVLARAPEIAHDLLFHLLEDGSRAVRQAGMLSAAQIGRREFLPALIKGLGDYHSSRIAADALVVYGPRIIGMLQDMLKDPNEPARIRQQVPGILARIPAQESVDSLLLCLNDADGQLRYRAIKALGKLRATSETLVFDRATIRAHAVDEVRKIYRLHEYLDTLLRERPATYVIDGLFLPRALEERVDRGIERVFRLLGLIGRQTDLYHAYLAVTSGDARRGASGVELLDNVLEPAMKKIFLPLVEEMTQQERAKIGRVLFAASDLDVAGVLLELMQHDSGWLGACAVEAAGAWQIPKLQTELMKLTSTGSPLVAETALLMLRGLEARAS